VTVEAMDKKNEKNGLFLERKSLFLQTHRHQLTKECGKFVRTRLETLSKQPTQQQRQSLSVVRVF